MKTLIAAAALTLLAGAAFAGEGNGEPFPAPDMGIAHSTQNPKYTMGLDAPYNYFYQPTPMPLNNYSRAASAIQDPFPFKMPGQMVQTAPAAPTSVAQSGQGGGS